MSVVGRNSPASKPKKRAKGEPAGGYYIFVPSSDFELPFPGISLPNLRKSAALKRFANPSRSKQGNSTAARRLLAQETFEVVADEWFEINKGRWVGTYSSRLRSRLDDDLLSELGDRLISEIEPVDVLLAIRKIEQRGAIESAKRIANMASAVFRYGVATGRCYRDPTADIRGALRPPISPKRRTALPAKDIPEFMQALTNYNGEPTTKLALSIIVLTFVRTGELRFAKWSEFENLEGKDALWRIPADRMKYRRPHLVPLAAQAVLVVKALKKLTGKSEYLLPANTKLGVISENTLLFALYRMGYHTRATVHGFRATASTILNEAQFNRDWIELQLAHSDDSIRGVYNSAEWLPGRREMMSWWANYLEVPAEAN